MAEETSPADSKVPSASEADREATQQGGGVSTAEGADGKAEAGRQGNSEAEDKQARETMREFEQQDELPSDLKKWPDGKAKFITMGDEDDEPYGEGPTEKLGPTLVHHEDGSVSADGEKVDNPEDYKGEPIPLAVDGMDTPEVKGQKDSDGETKRD
ncbi:MAG: hypothetical protein ACR2ND_04535 [Solirubrobacteraceae bacterium]